MTGVQIWMILLTDSISFSKFELNDLASRSGGGGDPLGGDFGRRL